MFRDRIPLTEDQATKLMNDLSNPNRQEAEAREMFLKHLMEIDEIDDDIDYETFDSMIPPKMENL